MTSNGAPQALPQPSARALASRRNGARSRGPKFAAGRARAAGNALKHGLPARRLARRSGATTGGRPWEPGAQSGLAARIVTTAHNQTNPRSRPGTMTCLRTPD
jgi:hypothetical protein